MPEQPPRVVIEPSHESNDGHARLDWTATSHGATYVVQRAPEKEFTHPSTVYKGPDLATFVSGLANGTYYFRVRSEQSDWSPPIRLHVEHHSLRLAFLLFSLGAIVFLLTVWVVLYGTYRTQME